MSSIVPCAPSNMMEPPSRSVLFSSAAVSATNGRTCSAISEYSRNIVSGSSGSELKSACAIVFFSRQAFSMCVLRISLLSRSTTRRPLRFILSSYAGPMPRDVVPILTRPGAFSAASSIIRWYGRMTWARFDTKRRPSTSRPASRTILTSFMKANGSRTTPLPMTLLRPGRSTPQGISCRTYFLPLMMTVWPALWPPA